MLLLLLLVGGGDSARRSSLLCKLHSTRVRARPSCGQHCWWQLIAVRVAMPVALMVACTSIMVMMMSAAAPGR